MLIRFKCCTKNTNRLQHFTRYVLINYYWPFVLLSNGTCQLVDEKKNDPATWPNLLNFTGDNRDEYFNQVQELALQINFLST
jgi:hypothetical protein